MSNIDDEIDKICQTLAWAGSYIDSGQQVVDEIMTALQNYILKEIIEPAEIEYDKYGKCPACGAEHMYCCTCDRASEHITKQQRTKLLKGGNDATN